MEPRREGEQAQKRSPVSVTQHAYDQALARFPEEYADRSHSSVCRVIGFDVTDAIAAGRLACNKPVWCRRFEGETRHDARRKLGAARPSMRYCWPLDESRLYLIQRSARVVVVVTVIRPRTAEAAA